MIALKTHSFNSLPNIGITEKLTVAFCGVSVDERGEQAISLCNSRANQNYCLTYRRNDYFLNGQATNLGALRVLIRDAKNILIECTTLGIVEIIFLIRAARKENIRQLSLLYAEPVEYSREGKDSLATATRFNLTGSRQFSGVHGVSIDLAMYDEGQVIFMLGYEDDRLAMLLTQQENLARFAKHALFGVPAFEPGWELNSFANHAGRIASEEFEIHYAGANSVATNYAKLTEIQERKGGADIPMVIAPIGTKPQAIAAALFLCTHAEHNEAALIYDHPEKKAGRSRALRRWHLYEVSLPAERSARK